MSVTEDTGHPAKCDALRVSVVIATYARPVALRRAVDSLIVQTQPPEEIIIALWSGDASTVAAVSELVRRTEGAHIPVIAVQVEENTVVAKENAAMAQATADIVCFMDDDAVARPEWVQRILRHYADPAVGAVGGRDVIRLDGVPEVECRRVGQVGWFGRLHGNHHRPTKGVREVDFLKGCNMSFRREVLSPVDLRLVGSVPYGFEIDMALAARTRGYRVVYDPEVVVDHYPSSNMSAKLATVAYVTNHNQTYILLKHFGWPQRIGFLLYTFLLGDRNTVGLLRVPWLRLREHWPAGTIASHFIGKIHGVRTSWSGKKAKPETSNRLTPRRIGGSFRRNGSNSSKSQPPRGGSLSMSG